MAIDISTLDKLQNKFEKAPDGKWYARTYNGPVIVYEDEIIGYSGGPVPGELQDVFAAQRLQATGKVVTATTNLTGGFEESFGETRGLVVLHRRFSDFSPSILASLVSGATYAQTGNTVTVTATAHGLPSNRNGFRIFWPGSAAIPAGWYGDFAYVDANAYTFTNPTSQTVSGGTALTAGLPYTNATVVCSALLEAGLLTDQGQLHAKIFRSGSANVNSKYVKITDAAGVSINASLSTTASAMYCATLSGYIINGSLVAGSFAGTDNTSQTDANRGGVTFDRLVDNTIRMMMSNSAASSWVSLESLIMEVVR